jgi:hypothetical protein
VTGKPASAAQRLVREHLAKVHAQIRQQEAEAAAAAVGQPETETAHDEPETGL